MFLRVVRASGGKGVKHEYLRLVEAIATTRERPNTGRFSILAASICWPHISISTSSTDCCTAQQSRSKFSSMKRSKRSRLGTGDRCWPRAISGTNWGSPAPSLNWAGERALVLVANRLTAPTSEHGLARWLETDFVRLDAGRRLNSMQVPFRLIPE